MRACVQLVAMDYMSEI